MQFEKGDIYHIYNQGNNRQKVFFNRENYLFFLRKMKNYILPYDDIITWCLMPNHFHFMVLVNETTVAVTGRKPSASLKATPTVVASSCRGEGIVSVARSDTDGSELRMRTFNDSIGIMLRSYTNAINKKHNRSGKLFREATKAECITCFDGITPSFYNTNSGTQINIVDPVKQYPELCFHYIHQNPVKAGLVKKATDWEFSSACDYAGLRSGKLVNIDVAEQYIIDTKID